MKYKVNAAETTVMAAATSTEFVLVLKGISRALNKCNSRQDFEDLLEPIQDAIRKALKDRGIRLEVVLGTGHLLTLRVGYFLPNYREENCAHIISSFNPCTEKLTIEVKEFKPVSCVKAEISEDKESVE